MSIVKKAGRKKPYYYVISTGRKLPNGRYEKIWSTTGYLTSKEALDAEAEARVAIKQRTYIKPEKISVTALLEKFIDTKIEIRPATRTQYIAAKNRVAKQPLGSKEIQKVDVFDVEAYRQWLHKDTKLSQQTIREELSFLRSAFTWAADNDIIVKSPARRLKLPPKPGPKGIHAELSCLLKILDIVKKEAYADLYIPCLLAGFCGLRISEICGVELQYISESGVQVKHNLLRIDGIPTLAPLKTRTSERFVPFLPFVWREIAKYMEFIKSCHKNALRQRMELIRDGKLDPTHSDPAWQNTLNLLYVFPEDGRPHIKDFIERRWRKFKEQNEKMQELFKNQPYLAGMRIHDFRHSLGANMRDQGVSMADISELLGHSDAEFTRVTYATPLKDTHAKAMQKYGENIQQFLS